jgi:hypothetical protein
LYQDQPKQTTMGQTSDGFFSDINKKMLIIAGGLISFYAFLPLFIDRIISIFPTRLGIAYAIALILYFLGALLFYICYSFIYRQYYNDCPDGKFLALYLLVLAFVAGCFLVFPSPWVAYPGVLLFVAGIVFIFVKAVNFKKTGYPRPANTENKTVLVAVVLIFFLFYITNWRSLATNFWQFDSNKKQQVFKQQVHRNEFSKLADHLQEWKKKFYKEAAHILSQKPDTALAVRQMPIELISRFKMIADAISAVDRNADQNYNGTTVARIDSLEKLTYQYVQSDSGAVQAYKVYEVNFYLSEYAKRVVTTKQNELSNAWVDLIVNVQSKGLLWLNLLFVLSFYLWMKAADHVSERDRELQAAKRRYARGHEEDSNEEKFIFKQESNLRRAEDHASKLKTLVYLSLLLVLPFFKRIETADLDVNHPFVPTIWPFSEAPGIHQSITYVDAQKPVDLGEIYAMLQRIDQKVMEVRKFQERYQLETIGQINKTADSTQQIILEQWNSTPN